MSLLNSLLFLVLGWLFGMLSPLIVDKARRERERKEVRVGIVTELLELQFRLAFVVYLLSIRHGTRDKEVINWLLPRVEQYPGAREEKAELIDGLKFLAARSDEEIKKLTLIGQSNDPKSFRKLAVPFLDSKLNYLSSFSVSFQYEILELRTDIGLYNEMVDEARLFFGLTFNPSSMDVNADVINSNLEQRHRSIEMYAKRIVEKVEKAAGCK